MKMSDEEVREVFQKFKTFMLEADPAIGKNIDVDKMVEAYKNPTPKADEPEDERPLTPEVYETSNFTFDFLFQRTVIDVPSWVVLAVSVIVRLL